MKVLKTEWFYVEPLHEAPQDLLQAAGDARDWLSRLDPDQIDAMDSRLSFWINVYNGAVTDHAIKSGVQSSVKQVRGFFRRTAVSVAGRALSLDHIEHGLLRANRRHPARLLPALWARPQLRAWTAGGLDPRIHFALNCGASSCPPIAVYTPQAVDQQLDMAAGAFLNAEVEVDTANHMITANPILRWYRRDFGDLEDWIRRYRDDGLAQGPWPFRWKTYDWSL